MIKLKSIIHFLNKFVNMLQNFFLIIIKENKIKKTAKNSF